MGDLMQWALRYGFCVLSAIDSRHDLAIKLSILELRARAVLLHPPLQTRPRPPRATTHRSFEL
jgi:hypothetical protein